MRNTLWPRLRSFFLATILTIGFVLLQGPLWKPGLEAQSNIIVRAASPAASRATELTVIAGKSVIVDSPSQIVRASVANPELAGTAAISAHEVLINGKTPGQTTLTLWQEGGATRSFDLKVAAGKEQSLVSLSRAN